MSCGDGRQKNLGQLSAAFAPQFLLLVNYDFFTIVKLKYVFFTAITKF